MTTTPRLVTIHDHPEPHILQWSELEMRWIEKRDAQWQAYATAARADLEAEVKRLRATLEDIAYASSDNNVVLAARTALKETP